MNFLYGLLGRGAIPDNSGTVSSYETASQISSNDLDPKRYVLEFLQQKTHLFDLLKDDPLNPSLSEPYDHKGIAYTLIKGCVQSGKSRIIHALCLYHTGYLGSNVLVMLRNFTDDYDQFQRGFRRFLLEFEEFLESYDTLDILEMPTIYYMGNIKRKKDNTLSRHEDMLEDISNGSNVILSLANHDQLSKLNECLDILAENNKVNFPLYVIIDEIDQIGYSLGDQFSPQFRYLVETNCEAVFGISATLFEPIQSRSLGFTTKNLYYLKPPADYKGVTDIQYHYIETSDKEIVEDKDLDNFLTDHKDHKPFQIKDKDEHPMIMMIKSERLIAQQDLLMAMIRTKFKTEYTVIIYNGTNCKLYSHLLKNTKIILPVCKKKGIEKDPCVHYFNNTPIPYVLQYLKNHGGATRFPRIIIIAYKLVGRGINIVSEDFGWHLTHMFYRPSKSSDITTMIQSMRLCGIYHDNIPLQCYLPQKDYENLYKGYMLQEDIFQQLGTIDSEKNEKQELVEWLKEKQFYKEKIPRCRLYKNQRFKGNITEDKEEDGGMSMAEFNKDRCITEMLNHKSENTMNNVKPMDQKEFARLTNDKNGMFKKWAEPTNQSAIARFMREGLDPKKEYTKKEITDLWKEFTKESLTCLCNSHIGKSKGYGKILTRKNNKYYLNKELIIAFEKYF